MIVEPNDLAHDPKPSHRLRPTPPRLADSPDERSATDSVGFKQIVSGALVVLAGGVLGRGLEFATRAIAARYLGPSDFGALSTAISLLSIVGTIVLLGLSSGLVHFLGKNSSGSSDSVHLYIRAAFWTVMLISVPVALVGVLFSAPLATFLLQNRELTVVVRYVALALPFFAGVAVISASFQGLGDAKAQSLVNGIALPTLRFGLLLLLIAQSATLSSVLGAYLGVALAFAFGLGLWLLADRRLNLFRGTWRLVAPTKRLVRFSAPLLIGSILGTAVWQLDVLLVQRFHGGSEAGLYASALILGRLPTMILLSFAFMTAPVMARHYSAGAFDELQSLYARTVDVITIAGFPITILFLIFPAALLSLLFGQAYVSASAVLRVLALGFFLHSLLGPNGNTLIMFGYSRLYLVDTLIATVISILLYVVLVPKAGALGAAVATVLGLSSMNALFSLQLFRFARVNPFSRLRPGLLPCGVLATALSWALYGVLSERVPSSVALGASTITLVWIYVACMLRSRVVTGQEVRAIVNLVTQRARATRNSNQ